MRIRFLIFGLLLFGCDVEQKEHIRLVSRTPVHPQPRPAADVLSEAKRASDGARVVPPTPIKRVEPAIPERPHAVIRFVAVEALVSAKGDVTHVKVIRGGDNVYTHAIAAALRKWKFRPGTIDGKPADMTYQLTAHIDVR